MTKGGLYKTLAKNKCTRPLITNLSISYQTRGTLVHPIYTTYWVLNTGEVSIVFISSLLMMLIYIMIYILCFDNVIMNQSSQSVKYKPLNGYVLNVLLIWPSFSERLFLQKWLCFIISARGRSFVFNAKCLKMNTSNQGLRCFLILNYFFFDEFFYVFWFWNFSLSFRFTFSFQSHFYWEVMLTVVCFEGWCKLGCCCFEG